MGVLFDVEWGRRDTKRRKGGVKINVSIHWIKENVTHMDCAGGQITIRNFEEYLDEGTKNVQTTLTRNGILAVENEQYGRKFQILIPGEGWADCWTSEAI